MLMVLGQRQLMTEGDEQPRVQTKKMTGETYGGMLLNYGGMILNPSLILNQEGDGHGRLHFDDLQKQQYATFT